MNRRHIEDRIQQAGRDEAVEGRPAVAGTAKDRRFKIIQGQKGQRHKEDAPVDSRVLVNLRRNFKNIQCRRRQRFPDQHEQQPHENRH